MSLQERLTAALATPDAVGVTAGDLLLCREVVESGQAARDRDVRLDVRDADRFSDEATIQPVTADWVRREGAFCALCGGCSLAIPGQPKVAADCAGDCDACTDDMPCMTA